MKEEARSYKQIFRVRKGGENGEKFFITVADVVLSSKFHDTEEDAVEELEHLNLETVTKLTIAVLNICERMIKENSKTKNNEN